MKLAINAVSAKLGGAVTYMQQMLPILRDRLGGEIVVWRGEAATGGEWPEGVEYRFDARASEGQSSMLGLGRRLWFDQIGLPKTLEAERFDTLFSSANFGPLRTRSRHVLLVRNALYFDDTTMVRLESPRARAALLAQRWLTLAAMRGADAVIFPSKAMLDLVARHAGGAKSTWSVAPYGTRHDLFAPGPGAERPAPSVDRPTELLNVAHYYDQKNFGTLLSALERLERSERGRFKLRITAGFDQPSLEGGAYAPRFASERAQFRALAREGFVEDVNWRRYGSLPALYHSADVFVFPSYSESFGHPLLEAMAAGLPIVASDIAVNREMCGDAAIYFPVFDAEALASALRRVREDAALARRLATAGRVRAGTFTWERHVEALAGVLRGASAPAISAAQGDTSPP